MSSSTIKPSFNKLLIRNMRRRFPVQLATVSDEDLILRHKYITQTLNTNLSRNPEHLKYMTGYRKLPDEMLPNPTTAKNPKSYQ